MLDWRSRWCWRLRSVQDTHRWGALLVRARASGLFCLQGELGSGKTTLVRGVLRALDHGDAVPSPSYTILEHYDKTATEVLHFDLYRITHPHELEEIGFRDYLARVPPSLCFVEWPERALQYFARPDGWLRLEAGDEERTLKAGAATRLGVDILERVSKLWDELP